jgi:hypothetical protein
MEILETEANSLNIKILREVVLGFREIPKYSNGWVKSTDQIIALNLEEFELQEKLQRLLNLKNSKSEF